MLDAYTVKKMLPRLILAVLLVNLSWHICVGLLNTTSVVGNAMYDLMWMPFESSYDKGVDIGGQLVLLLWGAGTLTFIPAALWVVIGGGWAVILTSLLSLAGILLVALVVLTLREMALIFLIIISPIALVAWVIPGTEQWAKRWWGLYTKLLLMFPAFMGLLALGEIMSSITNKNEGGMNADPIGNLIAIVMYVIPFFMLPFLFKMMGGFVGQVSGMINDKEKGLLDRSKNWSKDRTQNSVLAGQKRDKKELKNEEYASKGRQRLLDSRGFSRRFGRGRGMNQEDFDVLEARQEEVRVRRQSAQAKASNAVRAGHQLDAASDLENFKRSYVAQNPTATTKQAQDAGLDWIANRARKAAEDDDQDQYNALVSYLAQQKGEKQLNTLQHEAATGTNTALTRAWTGAVNNQTTYGDLKGYGVHYTAATHSGMTDQQLNDQRALAIHGASTTERATMPASAWTYYESASTVDGKGNAVGGAGIAATFEAEILANDTARSAYKGQRGAAPATLGESYDYTRRTAFNEARRYDRSELPVNNPTDPSAPRVSS